MDKQRERQTEDLANSYLARQMSRRTFVTRLLALGLAPSAVGAIVAACSSAATASPSAAPVASTGGSPAASLGPVPSPTAADLKGEVRFLIGPWTDAEVDHQKAIAKSFNAIYPNVTFTYKLFDWGTATTAVTTSLQGNAHDIYYFGEGEYPLWSASAGNDGGFEDLTSRINDASFASEKAKYLYWDRIANFGPKLVGLPICWHVENALFANMDLVRAAGYDETFVDDWDTFAAALQKMTKGTQVYGIGVDIQSFAEWYTAVLGAGGSFLSPDHTQVTINTPEVVAATQRLVDLFTTKVAVPQGTYDYTTINDAFAAGKVAVYSADLTISPILQQEAVKFDWKILPWPKGTVVRKQYNDLGFYAMNHKTADKALAWEVLKWWTNSDSDAYWADVSGTFPDRTDALDHGYGKTASKQLADSFADFQKYSGGPETFKQFAEVEALAEKQASRAYAGEISAADAVKNIASATKQAVFG